jgi:hypothetical protein
MQTFEIFVSDSHAYTIIRGLLGMSEHKPRETVPSTRRVQGSEEETSTESTSRISPLAVQVCTILLQSSTEVR